MLAGGIWHHLGEDWLFMPWQCESPSKRGEKGAIPSAPEERFREPR